MSDYLNLLKRDISKNGKQELLINEKDSTKEITEATHLKLANGKVLDLDRETDMIIDEKPVTLRAVYFSWINQNLSVADFVTSSQKKNIQTLTFLQRNSLINWLSGKSNDSEFIKSSSKDSSRAGAPTEDKMDIDDPFLDSILAKERTLINHNTSLRGFKPVDFSSVGRECDLKIVKVLKRKGADPTAAAADAQGKNKKRRQNPIILISPAASALITMANIKTFFEQSRFVDPNSTDKDDQEFLHTEGDIRNVTHVFPKIGKQTFLIVNNAQKFSKREYWERVVAVFTTGQQWQFKHYEWTKPNELFKRIKGYYFYYDKDPVPQQVKEWNIEKIGIDKNRRFKDAQVLNHFWDSLERSMRTKGW